MKNLMQIFLLILIAGNPVFLLPQEAPKPFIVSPLIGDKLDRVEEDYFRIFPGMSDFQEAAFYLNSDSSLNVNIKGYFQGVLVDSTFRYYRTLRELRERLNETVLKSIKEDKVREMEFITEDNQKYTGVVYSFSNDEIKLVQNNFLDYNYKKDPKEYFPELNYSGLNSVAQYESNTLTIVFLGILGIGVGAAAGAFLYPAIVPRESGFLDYRSLVGGVLGGILGGILGFTGGSVIKFPVEYNAPDMDSRQIIMENTLLQNSVANPE